MWPRGSDGWENQGASETLSREKPAHLWDDTASVKPRAALATSDMINNRPRCCQRRLQRSTQTPRQYIPELIRENDPCPEDTAQIDERLLGGTQLNRQGSPSNLLQEPQDRLSSKTEWTVSLSKYTHFLTSQHPNCRDALDMQQLHVPWVQH